MRRIDPITRASALRKTLVSDDGILVADFSETLQGKDTSKVIDLMPNIATGEMVFRAKVNIKGLDHIASQAYGVEYFDVVSKTDNEIEDYVKVQEFDFPIWYKHHPDFSMRRVGDYNLPFIMQVAGCNFHDGTDTGGCWYCFVDDQSNNGKLGAGKAFLRPEDAVESMLAARLKIREAYARDGKDMDIKVFRTSGGEPTIVLDWILAAWRYIGDHNLGLVGQLDSNLSTGPLVDAFERDGIYEPHTLEQLAEHPVKVLTALKGVSNDNLQSNVQSTNLMDVQEYSLKKFLKAGFDIYPQMYNPDPSMLESFLQDMDSHIENFSLRIHIGPLKLYGPNGARLTNEALRMGVDPQTFIARHKEEWDANYRRGVEVMDGYLRKTYGLGYKDAVRSDVPLRILD